MLNSVSTTTLPGSLNGTATSQPTGSSGITSSIPARSSSVSDGSNVDAMLNLTHLGGEVWQDAEGRPVTRSGTRLLTMVPVQPDAMGASNAFLDSNLVSFANSLSESSATTIAATAAPTVTAITLEISPTSASAVPGSPTLGRQECHLACQSQLQLQPHLNNAYWAPAEFVFDPNSGGGSALGDGTNAAAGGVGGSVNASSANAAAGMFASRVDPNMLDAIPGAPLDFANWDAYFSRMNQGAGSNDGSGNGGNQQSSTGAVQEGETAGGGGDGIGFANTTFGIEAQMMDAGRF